MANISKSVKLGVFTLAIMNVTAVVSLRGLPAEAEYGLSSAFYYLFAAIVFLIPTSLVAAELAAMFQDKQGGVFRWVGEAYGKKFGFLAIFLQWVESTIWYPTVLTFGAVALAFIGMSDTHDMALASNRYYSLAVVLIIYWLATFISLKGMGWVGKVAKVGGMVGTIIPAGLLMVLAVIYLASGGQSQMNFDGNFFPDFSNFDNLVLASSIFLFYAGMEMGGIHVKDMENPAKNYPKAVFIGAAITVIIFVLGTFALGIIIPEKDINLTQSLLVGFDNYFKYVHASWLSPIIAVALAFGVLAGVLTWVAGPSKGIFAVGKAGYLPPFFQKTNANGVQKNILLIQGLAVTLLSLLFVVMPSVQSFYQILSQLRIALPHHVSADVQRRHLSALQYEKGPAPVPHRQQRQRTDVAHRRSGFLRFAAGIRAQLHSAQPDCGRQQHRMVCRFDYRLRRGSRSSVHYLCIAQTVMGRQGYTVRTVPLGRTGHNGTDSGSGFRRG
jgi:putative glutamate/gamma-aminobutyrate antiporter